MAESSDCRWECYPSMMSTCMYIMLVSLLRWYPIDAKNLACGLRCQTPWMEASVCGSKPDGGREMVESSGGSGMEAGREPNREGKAGRRK
eukprot:3691876-Rhodomonas_salina.8